MNGELLRHEILGTLTVGAVAITILALADVLKRVTSLPVELTRKFAHIGSGVSLLLIPVFIESSWTVLVLTGSFAVLMLVTHLTGLLQGIHGVGRGVGGVLWYPFTGWLLYFLVFDVREGTYLEYAIPVLVLACADAMGAVVGRRWGRHRYEVITCHHRSIEGSLAFYITALVCIAVPLTFGADVAWTHALAVAALVSLLAMGFESVSVHGIDNLLVPFGTLLFLDHFLSAEPAVLVVHALLLASIAVTAAMLAWRRPATGGGIATFILACYTVLVLGGWAWLPPLVALIVTFVAWERLAPVPSTNAKPRYEMGTALIGLTVPVVLVLLYAAVPAGGVSDALHVGYLASIACQVAVLAYLLPQHKSFRLRRLRRIMSQRDAWQHGPTMGKVAFAATGAVLVLAAPIAMLEPFTIIGARGPVSLLLVVACATGLLAFITLAATTCARRACHACGSITLHGLGCCHVYDLGAGDAVARQTMTFRTTYLTANAIAASAAVLVVAAWMT